MFSKEPIRRRGYYRALKANKSWALSRKAMNDISNQMALEMFKPNPFLEMLKSEGLSKTIPIVYGIKTGDTPE